MRTTDDRNASQPNPGDVMSKVMEKVKEEFLAVLPPTIYFTSSGSCAR